MSKDLLYPINWLDECTLNLLEFVGYKYNFLLYYLVLNGILLCNIVKNFIDFIEFKLEQEREDGMV